MKYFSASNNYELLRAQPCCFALYQGRAEKADSLKMLIPLPHRTAMFMTSLIQTAKHQMVTFFSCRQFEKPIFNKQDEKSRGKTAVCIYFIPVLSIV